MEKKKKIFVGIIIGFTVAIISFFSFWLYMDQKNRKYIEQYKEYITNQPLQEPSKMEKSQPNE